MKILHCSDIHVCHPWRWRTLRGKRWAGVANWLCFRGRQHRPGRYRHHWQQVMESEQPDVVAVTGDLAQLGTAAELEEAAAPLYRFAASGTTVLYVPGNHDVYIPADPRAADVVARLCRDFGGGGDVSEAGVRLFRRGAVEFILLDQAVPNSLFASHGAMTPAQWEGVAALPARPTPGGNEESGLTYRIVLGHFPLVNAAGQPLAPRRRLLEGERLRAELKRLDAAFYLCGHIHSPYDRALGADCVQLVAGSLTAQGSYHAIELLEDRARWVRRCVP